MAHNYVQEYWRFRLDEDGLNSQTSGWSAAENTAISHGTGIHVRLRMKVRETGVGGDSVAHKLQVRRNNLIWVDVQQDGKNTPGTPAALLVASDNFSDAAAITTEYLTSTTTNINGEGIAPVQGPTNVVTAAYSPNNQEIEFEWNLKIMSFHDGMTQNVAGDVLDFRMVESTGTLYSSYATFPRITITETDYYIGGCFVETPANVVCANADGDIYHLVEPSESLNICMMIKSSDGGKTWREMDGGNRPVTPDIEAADFFVDGDTIHVGIQHNNDAYYHRFRMSDHATNPDTWEITDEPVATGITRDQQTAAIAARSDGTIVMFYQELVSSFGVMRYKIRSTGGTWGSAVTLDSTASTWFPGCTIIRGASDLIHIFYTDTTNGNLYHKSLNSSDTLSGRELVYNDMGTTESSDRLNMTKPVYWDDAGDEKIMVALLDQSDTKLYSVLITNDGTPDTADAASDHTSENNEGGNGQVIAAMSEYNDTVYLIYGRLSSPFGIWLTTNDNDGGWDTDVEQVASVNLDWMQSTIVQHSVANGGNLVLGYVYDDGSNGGTGNTWFGEYVIVNAPHEGQATLSGSGSIAPLAEVIHQAAASLEPFGDLVAEGFIDVAGSATLGGVGSVDATGKYIRSGVSSLDGAGTVSGAPRFVHSSNASLAGAGTLAAVGIITITDAVAAVAGSGTITAVAAVTKVNGADLRGSATITPFGAPLHKAKTTLAGVGTLTPSSSSTQNSGAILAGVGSVVANGLTPRTYNSGAILAGVGSVIPGGDVGEELNSGVVLAGVGTLAAIAEKGKFAFAVLAGVGSVTPDAEGNFVAFAVLAGVGGIRPVGRATPPGKAVLAGAGSLVGIANAALPARVELLGETNLRPKAVVTHPAQASLSGSATVISDGTKSEESGAILAGIGTLAAVGDSAKRGKSLLSGSGSITGTFIVDIGGFVSISGVSVILGAPRAIFGAVTSLSGVGTFTIAPNLQRQGVLTLSGNGTIAGVAEVVHQAQSVLDGSGSVVATAEVTHQAQAQFDGIGDVLAIAEVVHQAQTTMGGVGTFVVDGRLAGGGLAILDGVATIASVGSVEHGAVVVLSGVGTIDAGGVTVHGGASQLDGATTITASPRFEQSGVIQLSGVGSFVSLAEIERGGFAVLSGNATLTADQTMILAGESVLAGIGTLVPVATKIASGPVPFSLSTKRSEDTTLQFRERDLELEKVK